ncbi:MAG TPA: hypothetical protein ENN29_06515 [Candidatus Hydrogenedentes bacterium]|nr:hypothetical protein [Candidatus Hydrogenedentota bacterium]
MDNKESVTGRRARADGDSRRGEKLGWTGGFAGGFLWILPLGCVRLAQGHYGEGVVTLGLFVFAMTLVIALAPWRHPATPYYVLLLPVYAVFFVGVAWAVHMYGGLEAAGLKIWNLSWALPCLSPLFLLWNRRWRNEEKKDA